MADIKNFGIKGIGISTIVAKFLSFTIILIKVFNIMSLYYYNLELKGDWDRIPALIS